MNAIDRLIPALDRFLEVVTRTKKDDRLEPLQRRAEKALSRAFIVQGDIFLRRFQTLAYQFSEADPANPPAGWEGVAEQSEVSTQQTFTTALEAVAEDSLLIGITEAAIDLGLIPPGTSPFGVAALAGVPPGIVGLFDLHNPRAVQYISQHGAQLVAGINETTRNEIRTLLRDAIANGWSYDRTAREIRARFKDFSVRRAHVIAVTESARGYEAGNKMVASQLASTGVAVQKSWLAVFDGRVCPECEDNASQGWIPMDDIFISGADTPPGHPTCRCASLWRTNSGEEF